MSRAVEPEVSVGISDSFILAISITGFAVLASTFYFVLFRTTTTRSGTLLDRNDRRGDGAGGGLTYDQLKQTRVADLNRAQRRARARIIAREESKELAATASVTSKQERQRVQRDIELRERRAEQEERERIQQEQQQRAALAKEHRDAQKLQERTAQTLADLEKWETFLKSADDKQSGRRKKASRMTVAELIERLQRDPTLDVEQLSLEFHVTEELVVRRLNELVGDGRIAGVFTNNNDNRTIFIYFSDQDLRSIAHEIGFRQKVSYAELAAYINSEILQTPSTSTVLE